MFLYICLIERSTATLGVVHEIHFKNFLICIWIISQKNISFSQAGKDVVSCLNEAMQRQGTDMRVSALVCCFHKICQSIVN